MKKFFEEIWCANWWGNIWYRSLFPLIPLGIGIGLCNLPGTATGVAGLVFIGIGIGNFWSGLGNSIREGRKQVAEVCGERERQGKPK
ncbi:MAG: hypothetical protein WBH01_02135 [Dehalococcoidia bacterium]